MKFKLILSIYILFTLAEYSYEQNSCNPELNYKLLSTKTDYNLVSQKYINQDYIIPNCQQIGLWHLSRHGARFADYDDIIDMNEFLPKLRDLILEGNKNWLCQTDIERLKNWSPRMRPEQDNLLTKNGNETMRQLGLRTWARLKELFFNTRINQQVKVQATDIPRTIQSAGKYLEGAYFYWPFKPKIETAPEEEDYLLKFPDLCQKFIFNVDSNRSACPEITQFDFLSSKYRKAKADFTTRLGINGIFTESSKAFDLALKMCQYEYLMDKTDSIWCKFFDKDTLKLIEYREDLNYNCKYGYKYEISQLMTCDLAKNLLDSLKTYQTGFEKSDSTAKKIQLLFSHSSTLLPFFSLMGIGKGANNFNLSDINTENPDRNFRVSKLDPMNSNIAFLLFKCNDKSARPKYTLRTYHNEFLIKPDGCKSVDCNLDEFYNYFSFFLNTCVSTKESCKVN